MKGRVSDEAPLARPQDESEQRLDHPVPGEALLRIAQCESGERTGASFTAFPWRFDSEWFGSYDPAGAEFHRLEPPGRCDTVGSFLGRAAPLDGGLGLGRALGMGAGAHDRALPRFRVDLEPAVDRCHAVGETAQAGAPVEVRAAHASLTSTASRPSRWVSATDEGRAARLGA